MGNHTAGSRILCALLGCLGLLCWSGPSMRQLTAAEPPKSSAPDKADQDHAGKMARGLEVFKKQVRAILEDRCVNCHGGMETESEFSLTSRKALLAGGGEGLAIVPGNAQESRLYKLISHQDDPRMPQDDDKLPAESIAAIARWIDLGAPYDKPLTAKSVDSKAWITQRISEDDRKFWSFQPLRAIAPPQVKDPAWCRTGADHFILARLQEKGLMPCEEVSKRRLIRRAYLDLVGLPPTPEQIEQFVQDDDPQAYEKLIDRLLESPHYGERWARHWLDVARFAESYGFEHDTDRKHAYHYRDFVIKALNQDLPFDQFVRWQLAGDELAPDNPLALTATGFLGAGVFPTQITANEVERTRYDAMDDMIATMGSAMLGLTLGCARCHDHKYDPIPQGDYYRLLSTFTTTVRSQVELDMDSPPGDRQQTEKSTKPKLTKVLICSEGLQPLRLHSQGTDFFEKTYYLLRGDTDQKLGVAQQSFLQVLMRAGKGAKHWQLVPPKGWRTSYRRTSLSRWITDTQCGAGELLARVIVNRLWQHHIGRGIVATPNDFGVQGQRPTHPDLLDWLADQLIKNDWHLKPLHRLIMTSAVYRQGARFDAAKSQIDPDNDLCWRRSPRRLEAEIIRDQMLAVSGTLDRTMYGAGTLDEASKRRSIYFTIKRSKLIPSMQLFDSPQSLASLGRRPSTTTAPQALLFMNNTHVRCCARAFARQLAPAADKSFAEAVRRGYLTAIGREPDETERKDAVQFIELQITAYQQEGKANGKELALTDLCQVLMGLNEFIYAN